MKTGVIDRLNLDRGFLFIAPDDGTPDVFAHFRSLDGLEFDGQLEQRRVEFSFIMGERGPRATRVRAVD